MILVNLLVHTADSLVTHEDMVIFLDFPLTPVYNTEGVLCEHVS